MTIAQTDDPIRWEACHPEDDLGAGGPFGARNDSSADALHPSMSLRGERSPTWQSSGEEVFFDGKIATLKTDSGQAAPSGLAMTLPGKDCHPEDDLRAGGPFGARNGSSADALHPSMSLRGGREADVAIFR
jgi:hypothetical protein